MKKKTILIAGGTGFIGYHLAKKCVQKKIDKQETYYNNNEEVQDKLSNVFSILASNKSKEELQKNCDKEDVYRDKKFKSDYQDLAADTTLTFVIIFFTVVRKRRNLCFTNFFEITHYFLRISSYSLQKFQIFQVLF